MALYKSDYYYYYYYYDDEQSLSAFCKRYACERILVIFGVKKPAINNKLAITVMLVAVLAPQTQDQTFQKFFNANATTLQNTEYVHVDSSVSQCIKVEKD